MNTNTQSSTKINFIFSLANKILVVIIPIITAPYLSRVLGAEGIGIYSYTTSLQSYFSLVAILGTEVYGERLISRNRDDQYAYSKCFFEIVLLKFFILVPVFIVYAILIVLYSKYRIFLCVLSINILSSSIDISWLYTGLEKFNFVFWRNLYVKVIGIVAIFVFIKDSNDLLLYILLTTLINFTSLVLLWCYAHKIIKKIKFAYLSPKKHLKGTIGYFLPNIASSIYLVMDKSLIGIITHSESENGYYEQADKVIGLAKGLVYQAINSVMSVRISYLVVKRDFKEIKQNINISLNYIFFWGIGISAGIIGIADSFVPLFFGKGYDSVIVLLRVLAPVLIIIGVSNCLGTQYYTPFNKRKETVKYILVGAILNFSLNVILIPFLKSVGASIASIVAETTIMGLYIYHSEGFVKLKDIVKAGYKKLFAGIIMVSVMLLFEKILDSYYLYVFFVQFVVGSLAYLLMLVILRDEWCIKTGKMIIERTTRYWKSKGGVRK